MNPYATSTEPVNPSNPAPPPPDASGEMLALEKKGELGANWYFWIAGLSLVNTVIAHAGGDTHFVVGLAVTNVADIVAREIGKESPDIAPVLTVTAIAFSLLTSGFAVLFGWLSRKRWLPIMGLGMGLYLLDGLLCALLQDFMSAAFHAFALYQLAAGFQAYRKLGQMQQALTTHTEFVSG